MNTLAIIVACGKEEEISSGTETAFLNLGNGPVISHSLRTYEETPAVDGIIVIVSKDRVDSTLQIIKRFGCSKLKGIVIGGVTRLSSLRIAYSKLPESASTIIVHEASRPFVTREVIDETVKAAKRYGCAIAAHRLPDAVKVAAKGLKPDATLDRNAAWAAHTPQVFRNEVLEKILDAKNKATKLIDDESTLVQKPAEIHMVEAGAQNMKIRNSFDLAVATALLHANLAK
jgi:2-C-methyl-D-erythritol 4-phosphate cytidylyltransferase